VITPENLERVAELLRDGPKSARQVADALGISKPTAYTWLRALMGLTKGKVSVGLAKVQTGPGPRALQYRLKR
jgi:transposase